MGEHREKGGYPRSEITFVEACEQRVNSDEDSFLTY